MNKLLVVLLVMILLVGCGLPRETRRGVGTEGFLIILATPEDAQVLVDGERMGATERFAKNPLELKAGTHKIEVSRDGYTPEVREVYVGNQSRHTLKINLRPKP